MPRERILATVLWIIDHTLMRVGNEEYARRNDSYGATTLRKDHPRVEGGGISEYAVACAAATASACLTTPHGGRRITSSPVGGPCL